MPNNKNLSHFGRRIYLLKIFKSVAIAFFSILFITVLVLIFLQLRSGRSSEKNEIIKIWNTGDFEQVHQISKNELLKKPVDYFLLTINGFSAYELGVSQINSHDMLLFIDECIFSLRKALLQKKSSNDGSIYYVLGKAYGYKGNAYADLAVKYLEMANNVSYQAEDIPEYLGLAYAACGDYRNSVASFSQAFVPGKLPSSSLLLPIARSYMGMEEYNMAAGYLKQCIDISPDSKSIVVARLLLADIYIKTGDYNTAEEQYFIILNDSGENAEAHFQLGELYNLKGDTTKARAEWRLAYRQNPAHAKAKERLNI